MDIYNKPSPQEYLMRYSSIPPSEYMAHHGILGQKWGKRNGPPYPLDASDHSASEKKAGWRKSLDKSETQEDNSKKKGLSDGQKRAIKIGVALAATALIAYGGYKLKQSGKLDPLIEKGSKLTGDILGQMGDKTVSSISSAQATQKAVETVHGFKKLGQSESVSDVISKVNVTGNHNNCYNVVTATVGRLCGLDVFAKGDTQSGKGLDFDDVCKVFKLNPDNDRDILRITHPSVDSITRQITKRYSEGDVGAIGIEWNDAYKNLRGLTGSAAHTLNWIIRDGQVEFIDGQAKRSGDLLKQFISTNLDSGKEASIAKFGNIIRGLNLDTDVDLDLFKKFVD